MFNTAFETNEVFSLVYILILHIDDRFLIEKTQSPDISKSRYAEQIFISRASSRWLY